MILDTHQHFWKIDRGDYHWMPPADPVLTRDYLAADLRPLLRKAGVTHTILVQAAQTEAETRFLLNIAAENDFIAGVTGWLDLEDADFPDRLEQLRRGTKLVALRPMLQDLEDDAWIVRPAVIASLRHIAAVDFRFEFLALPQHLPHVITALEHVPQLRGVINHLAKPPIESGALEPWASLLSHVADFPRVYCKLSGMVNEAGVDWHPLQLRPYIDHAIAVFGAERLMFGSDWPVCLLAAQYGEVINALRTVLQLSLDPADANKVFFSAGQQFYGLDLAPRIT